MLALERRDVSAPRFSSFSLLDCLRELEFEGGFFPLLSLHPLWDVVGAGSASGEHQERSHRHSPSSHPQGDKRRRRSGQKKRGRAHESSASPAFPPLRFWDLCLPVVSHQRGVTSGTHWQLMDESRAPRWKMCCAIGEGLQLLGKLLLWWSSVGVWRLLQ